jgi:hypothetical protein
MPFTVPITVRGYELDANGHLNQATLRRRGDRRVLAAAGLLAAGIAVGLGDRERPLHPALTTRLFVEAE